jgi:xanthine dehydrogenase iron-sulfur cluster and FAD-binding subunit A
MLLREVEYVRPSTIEEAIGLLSEHAGARALAGGQTLVNVMKARAASPDVLVDLRDLDELKTIAFSGDGAWLEIGAMVTNTQLAGSSEVEVARPVLAEVAATIADVQIRNRGTVGGNVCVNDPTNHYPPLLTALGASFTIRGTSGERVVSADEFFVGVYVTAVEEGELLTRISVPTRKPGTGDAMAGCHGGPGRRANRPRLRLLRARAGDGHGGCARRWRSLRAGGARCRRRPGSLARSPVRRPCERRLPPSPGRGLGRARGAAGRRESKGVAVSITATTRSISVEINGTTYEREVPASMLLVHFLRDELDLTGTHVGCDTGSCGACTVLLGSDAVKSCCILAVQADGSSITTVEGLAGDEGELTPLQQAFNEHHALQCGYCTPGMLMSATALLEQNPHPSETDVKVAIQGNICRCTGYWNIVEAVVAAGEGGAR